jgi:hypothetical protein
MRMPRVALSIALTVLATVWQPATAFGQTYTATLTGTVVDPGGAAVPKVKVVAVNQATKLENTAETSDAGVYRIPFLPVGTYVVTAELAGFKKVVSGDIQLEVNQTARVDLTLELGAVTDEVTVSGVSPVLQTENPTVGTVISGNTTVGLPLNGRNFQQLTLLIPGTITPNPSGFTGPGLQGGQGRPFVNGNREQGNAFLLDGISVDETIDNRIGYKPNIDALAEFKIETSNSSAEFGNVTGATVNATLKSGSNDLHGNGFEFFRDDALDANSWANNRNHAAKNDLRQNIYGGTLGGPIMRNQIFFFTDYQGVRQKTGGTALRTVAPAEWRAGDLSSIPTPIIDPETGVQFPGNRIPAERIVNPVAKNLFANPALYPLPTRPGTANIPNNYTSSTRDELTGDQFDVRIDARLSDTNNVSGRYSFANFHTNGIQGALPVQLTGKSFNRPQNIALNWTRIFSPTIVNEARVGFNRAVFITDVLDWAGLGNGNATLGIAGTQVHPGLSSIDMGNGLSAIGNVGVVEDNVTNTFHYGDNLTITHGRHSMKMGGQWLRYQQNRFYPGNNGLLGLFVYGGTAFTGSGFADFLLDRLSRKGVGSQTGTWGHRQNRIGVFFQDDLKMQSNLTLNLGIRWEYTSPVYEVHDRQSNFDITTGKQLFAGRDGNSRALYEPYYKGFEPRIGFAWTPKMFEEKLVVRAGYGITQYMEGTGSNLRLPLNAPFFSEADTTYDRSSGPGSIASGFTDLLATGQIFGQIRVWNPDLRPQFTQQYNLTFEYQLTPASTVTLGYVGHNATHLVAPTDWNQPLPGTGPPSTWVPFQQRRPLYAVYPLVTQISGTDSWAVSNYNALQAGARRRYANGLEFLASYTWSKTLTDNLGYYGSAGVAAQGAYSGNNYNRHDYNYGPAFFDATHNITTSAIYELPFFRNANRAGWNGLADAAFGGWNVGGILNWHTGFPITVTAADNSLQNPRGAARPNRIGDGKPANQTIDHWLDETAFTMPALGSFGDAGVGIVRAPKYFNLDMSLGKKFPLGGSKYVDFRAEFFNVLNHPSFNPPAVNFSAPNSFGRITSTISPPRNLEFALKFYF